MCMAAVDLDSSGKLVGNKWCTIVIYLYPNVPVKVLIANPILYVTAGIIVWIYIG